MGHEERSVGSRYVHGQGFGIIPTRFYLHCPTLDRAGAGMFSAAAYRLVQFIEVQEPLVGGTRKPFRRYPADPLALRYINLKRAIYLFCDGHRNSCKCSRNDTQRRMPAVFCAMVGNPGLGPAERSHKDPSVDQLTYDRLSP